ncbi:hypothetical protein KAM448_13180 [Aeromonas caviae]|uniref:Uncharacterized protein n=1 Tax=Aeromonas caviae TaxID=648 RepID=A0ABD0B6A9_AERCA|nr:hypothetical protein KAM376_01270 [Aeromonas caviae]GJA82854.1 hypothetical protein KAM355_34140 [Aeromonas caviae]GJA98019.1 hypothetical protein KAM359_14270 [Aeromonas caviae]GJB11989.1 hypothetical protein KAM362_25490 [Aeromonas caviae]GJB23499.1 hypothetical protein KAM365_12490 [Aeromonas caviae]
MLLIKKRPDDDSSGLLFSHIQLREIKGLKDRTSYLCTLRRQLYSKAAESESNLCNLVSMVEKRKNIHNFHADKKIPSTNTGEL